MDEKRIVSLISKYLSFVLGSEKWIDFGIGAGVGFDLVSISVAKHLYTLFNSVSFHLQCNVLRT